MIIKTIKSSIVQNRDKVLNVYQSLHQHGSTCPCHGTPISICKSSKLSSNHLITSNNNNNFNNNKLITTTYNTINKKKDIETLEKFNVWSQDRMIKRYSSGVIVNPSDTDYAFELATSNIRFGKGVTQEVGMDLIDLHAKNVVVFADPNLSKSSDPKSPVNVVCESLRKAKINYIIYDRISIEPTDQSFKDAIEFVKQTNNNIKVDAFVAVGGGSTIDTAKAANLYTSHPTDNFLDYVNAPIGLGKPVPGDVKPLIAIPTTAGTGSETTGVAVFDLVEMNAKTGIASRRLKPTLGLVDPNNTASMPFNVAVASGFDQLCHSLESYTAIPFDRRSPRPLTPTLRPTYQGANPISDVWSTTSLKMINDNLAIAVEDPTNEHARSQVMLAATYAGVGFGNAGVHLCHGMSYAVSGLVKNYFPKDYNSSFPIIPHGMSVVLNAPAVFQFTGIANPERHLYCAKLMGADVSNVKDQDAGDILANQLRKLIKRLKVPNGLSAINYTTDDIPALVQGTIPQHRVTKLSPRPVGEKELTMLFNNSMTIY